MNLIADFFRLYSLILKEELKNKVFFIQAIPALIALGQAGYQAYQGYKQKKAADKLKPSNYVPPGVREAESSAKAETSMISPGYNRGLQKLQQSTANTINMAKRVGGNPTSIQQAVSDADAREKETIKDLETYEQQNQLEARRGLRQIQMGRGAYEKESRDDYNAAKSALIGASKQNTYNALTTLGEGVVASLPDKAFGGDGQTTSTAGNLPTTTPPPTAPKLPPLVLKRKPKTPRAYDSQNSSMGPRGLQRFRTGSSNNGYFDPSLYYNPPM